MARHFQNPDFRRDEYQRPDQKWVCGRACEGKGCLFGPDPSGLCHTTGECRPVKSGDRWGCTRPDTHGGPCKDGPLPTGECCHAIGPCQPVLSLRARRGRWVWAAAALTLGFLLVLLDGSGRERRIDPGTLTSAHALSNTRCNDCHAPAPGDAGLAGLVSGVHAPASDNCLKCHDLGDHPLSPHGFDHALLARLGGSRATAEGTPHSVVLAVARLAGTPGETGRLDCVACHKEHHGRDRALTGFTDQQCQVCHRAAFDSFSSGHPEFARYPFSRRTRIVFDHAKHMLVHFSEGAAAARAPAECSACHAASATGAFMLVKTFEQTCAACHGAQIEGEGRAGDKGIAFFRVPGLDAATLAQKGHGVGEWPQDADGAVTPFMRLLLERDAPASAALTELEGVDLTDLRGASEERLAAAATLAWSVKSLFADLVTDGQAAIISRMGQVAGGADREHVRAMTAQLPRDGLMAAQGAWFPGLFMEMANYRAGVMPVPSPAAKLAVPAAPSTPAKPSPAGDNLLSDTPPSPPAAAKPASGGDDLLSDAPAAPTPKAAPPAKPDPDDLLSGADVAAKPYPAAGAKPAVVPLKVNDAESWAVAGGWYRPADSYTLFYRPTGHADAFLTLWLTFAGRRSGDPRSPVARPLFAALSDPKAPGLCIKCHSVDSDPSGPGVFVNWVASRPSGEVHAITKFNHATHFSLLTQQGCQTCHQLKTGGAYLAAFDGNTDPSRFESGFAGVSRETCASCHNARVAREDCLLCHNYHTGELAARIASSGPMKPLEGKPTTMR